MSILPRLYSLHRRPCSDRDLATILEFRNALRRHLELPMWNSILPQLSSERYLKEQKMYTTLKASLARFDELLRAGIHRLPADVLSLIFRKVVLSCATGHSTVQASILAGVTRQWRLILLAECNADLWTHVELHVARLWMPFFTRLCFNRAGTQHLSHITVLVQREFCPYAVADAIKLVTTRLRYTKSLRIHFEDEALPPVDQPRAKYKFWPIPKAASWEDENYPLDEFEFDVPKGSEVDVWLAEFLWRAGRLDRRGKPIRRLVEDILELPTWQERERKLN
ncbi:unnamed protein product [Mycena citricolor]|uniref:F-box domain-containing protein n=1 Tax=Mycena citricolor TaxID=2018698 RepID=A0AAD2HAY8_9AGAR|nr:unnamed protein product [Mycena citricolor]